MTQQLFPLGDRVAAKVKRDRATVRLERAMRAVARSNKGKQDNVSCDQLNAEKGCLRAEVKALRGDRRGVTGNL